MSCLYCSDNVDYECFCSCHDTESHLNPKCDPPVEAK